MSAFATLSLTASTAIGGDAARMGGMTMMTITTTTIPMAGET